jgi:hypothetical protein
MQHYLNLLNSPRGNYYVFLHFTDGETMSKEATCINKFTQLEMEELGLEPDFFSIPELDS